MDVQLTEEEVARPSFFMYVRDLEVLGRSGSWEKINSALPSQSCLELKKIELGPPVQVVTGILCSLLLSLPQEL
jgi:hypothetical protein